MSEWQLIETAPKNGEPVLGYSTENVSYVCWWNATGLGWCFFENGNGDRWYFNPTHWMALPEPPSAALGVEV